LTLQKTGNQSTRITVEQALQFIQAFLVREISLTDALEPTARALGRMEAYKMTLKTVDGFMERTQTKEIDQADRSHVKALSENLP